MTTVEEHIDKLEEATKVLEARLQTATATLAREIKSLQDERLRRTLQETHTGD